ncbi:unnamed protein product [Bemisia tabaci]|uniref:Ig-like domain-containing protein n=1 Tax=Bemisia tabaci TaxID=7038 RepID=A0A9P0ACW9_BEMTA|nr:unnamed protein product [Bemisia tabaci]
MKSQQKIFTLQEPKTPTCKFVNELATCDWCVRLVREELRRGYVLEPALHMSHNYWESTFSQPYFDNSTRREMTTTVGQTAYLHCRVRNLGDRASRTAAGGGPGGAEPPILARNPRVSPPPRAAPGPRAAPSPAVLYDIPPGAH